MTLSPEVWVAVGTGVLALATFVLAGITAWNVSKTGGLVTATEKAAEGTKATVKEIQRDRELAHQPYLSWRVELSRNAKQVTVVRAWIANFGRGPALDCLCCIAWAEPDGAGRVFNLLTTGLFDLGPNEPQNMELSFEQRSGIQFDKDVAGSEIGEEPVRVAFCQDHLGNYFRFVPFEVEAEVYNPKHEKKEKPWMVFYQYHHDLLTKHWRPAPSV